MAQIKKSGACWLGASLEEMTNQINQINKQQSSGVTRKTSHGSRLAVSSEYSQALVSLRLSVVSVNLAVVVRQMNFPFFLFTARGMWLRGEIRLHMENTSLLTGSG